MIRQGENFKIPASQLVVGDLIRVSGSLAFVQADCILIDSKNLVVNHELFDVNNCQEYEKDHTKSHPNFTESPNVLLAGAALTYDPSGGRDGRGGLAYVFKTGKDTVVHLTNPQPEEKSRCLMF